MERGHGAASGITIPWMDRDRLALVKIRQPEGTEAEVRRSVSRPPRDLSGPVGDSARQAAGDLEGEFDALLLGQELGDLAAVVTLGSAIGPPAPLSTRCWPPLLGTSPMTPTMLATRTRPDGRPVRDESGPRPRTRIGPTPPGRSQQRPLRLVRPGGRSHALEVLETRRWPLSPRFEDPEPFQHDHRINNPLIT